MLFISDIDKFNDIVTVCNTDTNTYSKLSSKDLVRFHKETGLVVKGLSYFSSPRSNKEYKDSIIVRSVVFDNNDTCSCYVISRADVRFIYSNSDKLSAKERYEGYISYICKMKLCGINESIISITVSELNDESKIAKDITFNYMCFDDSFTKLTCKIVVTTSDSYNYDSKSGQYSLILTDFYNPQNTKVIDMNIRDIDVVNVPNFVEIIDFDKIRYNYPVIFKIHSSLKFVLNSKMATPNIILKIPKSLEDLFSGCNCLKLFYEEF